MSKSKVLSSVRPLSERTCAKPPSGKMKAKQAFKDEVDINSIVSRFVKSGVPIPAPQSKPSFLDMAALPSNLHDALMLKERLRTTISTFSPSLQAAYNANPNAFLRDLDAHLANLKAAEKAVSVPKPEDKGETPPPKA